MGKLSYILYKIINNILFRFRWARENPNLQNVIIFDINHNTTHLGDRLFLVDLIYSISESNLSLFFFSTDYQSIELFKALSLPVKTIDSHIDGQYLSLKSMYAARFFSKFRRRYMFIDNAKYDTALSKAIAKDFCQRMNIKYKEFMPNAKAGNNKRALLSNYIDSGFFRKNFCDEAQLYEKCVELRKDGFEIVHVGSYQDKLTDMREFSLIDKDLRGETNIHDIVQMFVNGQVGIIITYDNLFLHLGSLFGIETHVLFRGRFTRKASEFHYNAVNTALTRRHSRLYYLGQR